MRFVSAFVSLFISASVWAQVISPNSQEVKFSYTAQFEADDSGDPEAMAYEHSSYLFGVMHSAELTESFRLNSELIGGVGSPRADLTIRILNAVNRGGRAQIRYSVRGTMLLHNRVAQRVLQAGTWDLPLPLDGERAFDKDCTDEHYDTFGDYWYFWNPFRSGCEHLQENPYSQVVTLNMTAAREVKQDTTPRLDLLRGANGNGELFSIYVVHGFAESNTDPRDDNRVNYENFTDYLKEQGFDETVRRSTTRRPLRVYTKQMELPNGRTINVEVKSLLVDTEAESRGVTFARFFREAVQTGDVIFYSGHSGLGGNLDIPTMEAEAGAFVFPRNKRQIFFFDSCSSYSYYLTPFAAEKTKARIDVVTNALSSYFYAGPTTLNGFMDVLLSERIEDMPWIDILRRIERPLNGESYLLSVGGI